MDGERLIGLNVSGLLYNIVPYGVDRETEQFDFDEIRRLAQEHQPKLIISGASAYPRSIDFATFTEIAHEVGALHMADIAHIAGLVATGLHESPVPSAEFVLSAASVLSAVSVASVPAAVAGRVCERPGVTCRGFGFFAFFFGR